MVRLPAQETAGDSGFEVQDRMAALKRHDPPGPMRVLFLIRALSLGGAEQQLVLIAEGLERLGHEVSVLTFYPGLAQHEERLSRGGVGIRRLRKRGRWDVLGACHSLVKEVRQLDPDVVYSFLPTSNVVSALIVRLISKSAIVWGIRGSSVELPRYDWLGRLIAGAERRLRRVPDMVICNSQAGYELCLSSGYPSSRLGIVRNAIDVERNRFDAQSRERFRAAHGLSKAELVVGLAGRLDPMKGLDVCIRALKELARMQISLKVMVAGEGPEDYTRELKRQAAEESVSGRMLWLGRVEDMPAFYSAIDVFCSSSIGEGMSNVIAEALACGRLCVATRVGDSSWLVRDDSLMADPGDWRSMTNAISNAVSCLPSWNGDQVRQRIAEQLSAEAAIADTQRLLAQAIEHRCGAGSATATKGNRSCSSCR